MRQKFHSEIYFTLSKVNHTIPYTLPTHQFVSCARGFGIFLRSVVGFIFGEEEIIKICQIVIPKISMDHPVEGSDNEEMHESSELGPDHLEEEDQPKKKKRKEREDWESAHHKEFLEKYNNGMTGTKGGMEMRKQLQKSTGKTMAQIQV